ncbi:MAG TPA: DNA-3-methyladenine glycosylase [Solirubrobacteraceae bacterium]|nr:DNA-3-methyladenine glycosylase [Solirubrobacteraceae bacterium]
MTADGLSSEFYDRPVVEVARALLGCTVSYAVPGGSPTAGVIVETEAYHESEPACHAFVGLTPRTRTLFGAPGHVYVYRSYGIHALLNAVCEREGVGAAVLIRALQPLEGLEQMRARRAVDGDRTGAARRSSSSRFPGDTDLCSGPGKLTQALGVGLAENGGDLRRGPVKIHGPTAGWENPNVVVGTRVGITKAVELPWRFCVAGNPHVSRPRPRTNDVSSWRHAWA